MSNTNENTIIIWASEENIEIINKAIEKYQNINSETTFEVITKSQVEIEEELSVRVEAEEELPNIILVNDEKITELVMKYPRLFSQLDEYIDKDILEAFKAKNITVRGNVYASPFSSAQVALYYRKDILREYLGQEELPDDLTWEEYIHIGIELKENGYQDILPSIGTFSKALFQSTGHTFYNEHGIVEVDAISQTVNLINILLTNELVASENTSDIASILDLISANQLFSFIGAPYLFTKTKELVENENLNQEWQVARLPKNEKFIYDVNFGGASFMVINHEEEQDYVYDFLSQIFVNNNEESVSFYNEVAEYYDMVPSTAYMKEELEELDNDGCFYNQQVIKFLYEISEEVPGIYYGEYDSELTKEFQETLSKLQNKTLNASATISEFENICENYAELILPPILDYIVIETPPNKIEYYEYERFDKTGMVVRAYFVDGTTAIVDDYHIFPDSLVWGTNMIEVSYSSGGVTKSEFQSVIVYKRNIININVTPTKQNYFQTDILMPDDFRVLATFNIGNDDYIKEFSISPNELNNTGEQTITITCIDNNTSYQATVEINVKRKLMGLNISSAPQKTSYLEGEYFNPNGMVVQANYSDETSGVIEDYTYEPTSALEYETTSIQIIYDEDGITKEINQPITVLRKSLEKIEIENIRNTNYLEGEYIAKSTITVRAYYNNDTTKIVKNFELLTGEDEPLEVEDNEVEVSYTENGITCFATYIITVSPKILTRLSIKRKPYKLMYESVNENNLDLSGLILQMEFNEKVTIDFSYDIYLSNKTKVEQEKNNQEFINGEDIGFRISEKEANSDKRIVTIFYEETSKEITKEDTFTVYDVGTNIQTIYVAKQPNKRRYYVGEEFDMSGMIVEGNFLGENDQITTKDVTEMCFVSSTPLKPGQLYVTINYENDNNQITHQTKVAITLDEQYVDNSKQEQTELTYASDCGEARLNLFNKRLSFEHFDVKIGANTFVIACSHIYNNKFKESTSLKYGNGVDDYYKTRMGQGFKLSLQQYLIYDNTYNRYIYIDSAGYRHYFESLGDGTRYYDTTNTNLLLKEVEDKHVIYDISGNKLYFKNGVIVKSVSCFNNNYAKIYEYDILGRLIKVYDKRKASNIISFEYDEETDLLSTIKCKVITSNSEVTKKTITYSYKTIGTSQFLNKIEDGDITTILEYDNNKNLILAYNKETKSCIEFKYKNTSIIKEVTCGIIDATEKRIPSDKIIQKNVIENSSDNYKMIVRNQKLKYKDNAIDVVMEYHFNANGYTVAVLEENSGFEGELKTLEKEPGVKVDFPTSPTTSNTINNQKEYKYTKGRMYYSTSSLERVDEYRLGKYNNYNNFTIRFWAKLKYVLKDPKILVTIKSKDFFRTEYNTGTTTLDNSAIGVWQLVSVPIKIEGDNVKEITISMASNFNQGCEICDVTLYSSPTTSLNMISKEVGNSLNINNAKKIVYTLASNNKREEKEIGDTYFITQEDLKYTMFDMYQNLSNMDESSEDIPSFILSMCGCTKKVWVKEAKIETILFPYFEYGLTLKENSEGKYYNPLYIYAISSPDDEMKTRNYFEIYQALTIGNFTGPVIKGTAYAISGTKNPETSYTSTYADFFGRVLKEVDEYGVTKTYEYNEYGEITKKIIGHNETEEKIVFNITTSDIDTIETTEISYNKIEYDEALGYVEKNVYNGNGELNDNALEKTYVYNDSKTRIKKVSNNLGGENILTYQNNMLSRVMQVGNEYNPGYGYEIEYDRYNNPFKYYLIDGENEEKQLLTENIVNYSEGTIINKRYRKTEDEGVDSVKASLNKYGKTTSIVENFDGEAKYTNFIYQDLDESGGTAQVKTVEDPFEQRTYKYFYDEYNKCTGYDAISKLGNFSVKRTKPNEVTYFKGNGYEKKSIIEYDQAKLISPRITKTTELSEINVNYYLVTEYKYDLLGRLKEKVIIDALDNETHIYSTYLEGTLLLEKLEIKLGKMKNLYKTYHYTYDKRGRITEIKTDNIQIEEFKYDKANHLIEEKLITGEKKNYTYNLDGTIHSETTNDTNQIEYEYEKGRLKRRGNQVFEYDNLGNCLKYEEKDLKWYRGSLLKEYKEGTNKTEYSYDGEGVRFKKVKGEDITIYIHDSGKLITEIRKTKQASGIKTERIDYIYDANGISGFRYNNANYIYVKDEQGNVRSILVDYNATQSGLPTGELIEIVSYDYDAWGNVTVHENENSIINGKNIGEMNPIRWKSAYYDTESGLYYIGGRYYSPKTKQYLSGQNVETVQANSLEIYGLNLYSISTTNPLDIGENEYTIDTVMELAYDPPELSKWTMFWNSTIGKIVAINLAHIAALLCLITGHIHLLLIAAGTVIASLALGAAIAGIVSAANGKDFWRGVDKYINRNWARSVAIESIFLIMMIGISVVASAFKPKSKLKSYELDPRSIEKAKQGNPSFETFRKRVWKYEAIYNRGAYKHNQIELMEQGLAPKVNGVPMHLHHVVGKKVDLYNVVKLTRDQHILFHKTFGYHLNSSWNMESIEFLFG